MSRNELELFLNDNFKVLSFMNDNLIAINKAHICPMTQQEIGEALGFSLMKVNSIMQLLQKKGYIDKYRNSRGRYVVTSKGKKVLKITEAN